MDSGEEACIPSSADRRGQTELVRALAVELFETEDALIRLDMSEYMENIRFRTYRVAAGYVGYDDARLPSQRKPFSVILLDEMKAHPDVFNMLLQILTTGVLRTATAE